jgi:hypothetical protein
MHTDGRRTAGPFWIPSHWHFRSFHRVGKDDTEIPPRPPTRIALFKGCWQVRPESGIQVALDTLFRSPANAATL